MREAFGFECRYTMGLECTVEDIENAGSSVLNLVIRTDALEAAELLREKCGTPYFYGTPYGYAGTLQWLENISEMTGEEINPKLVQRLKDKMLVLTPPTAGPMAMMRREKPFASQQGV